MPERISPDRFIFQKPGETVDRIKRFLRGYKERTRAGMLVLGLSGGVDSSVTAALCSLAVGGRNVLGVSMPERETWDQRGVEDSRLVARRFGIRFKLIEITGIVDVTRRVVGAGGGRVSLVASGNVKARLRALVWYYFANVYHGLVVGTTDKSEMMLGYFTKYGDGACDVEPLADLYKTSVVHLAKYLGLPARIFQKTPSPGLWPGQTAEEELGLDYGKLDMILWGLERWMSVEDIARDTGLPVRIVRNVRERWLSSEHKRRPPLSLKLGYRTAGSDLRLPY